jgi:hypothetical protein
VCGELIGAGAAGDEQRHSVSDLPLLAWDYPPATSLKRRSSSIWPSNVAMRYMG